MLNIFKKHFSAFYKVVPKIYFSINNSSAIKSVEVAGSFAWRAIDTKSIRRFLLSGIWTRETGFWLSDRSFLCAGFKSTSIFSLNLVSVQLQNVFFVISNKNCVPVQMSPNFDVPNRVSSVNHAKESKYELFITSSLPGESRNRVESINF